MGYEVRWMTDLQPPGGSETRELTLPKAGTSSAIRHASWVDEAPQQICAMVFADVVGFSKLKEREIPKFAAQYLSCAMETLRSLRIVPLAKNTWGDGLYLVFDSMPDAGLFSIEFRDKMIKLPWEELGFRHPLSVRIGVHAGPVYRIYDGIFGQWTYTGTHVTRAARLEPSTDPGKVFCSLTFAALAAAERVDEFECTPAGRRSLAKGAGEAAIFEVTHPK
jgi:class 3 adenylate cyclase